MKKAINKSIAVLIAVLMAVALPISVFASTISNMTLTTSDKCYAGVTYDVVATITDVTESELIEAEQTAFTWETDNNSSIYTTNDYKYTLNSDEKTYTVSETAKVSLPEEVGTTIVTATYGDSKKTLPITTLQPITSISVSAGEESDDFYYLKSPDSSNDTLYLNSYVSSSNFGVADLKCDVLPDDNEDSYVVTSNIAYTSATSTPNGFKVQYTNASASVEGVLSVIPSSGYKFTKKINLVKCTALTSFEIKSDNLVVASTSDGGGGVSAVAGDSLILVPSTKKPSNANDSIQFTLYNDSEHSSLAPSNYCTTDESGNCLLNISNPGTYYLNCKAVSEGGYIPRNLEFDMTVTISEANPITSLNFLQLNDNGDFTDKALEQVTLYTNTAKTYDISKNLSILPVGYSHSVVYLSNDDTIATISSAGVITAKKSGTTTVYAYSEKNPNIITSCQVKVVQEISQITNITADTFTLPQGHSVQLTAVTNPTTSDEKINWASQNPSALTISQDGYATANPDYDLDGADQLMVTITATSESGKQSQKVITIVPAIEAKNIQINTENLTEATNSYTAFKGNSFKLSAVGTDAKGNVSNDIYVWTVSVDNGASYSLDDAVTNGYLTYKYESSLDTYTITPTISGKFDFYCYAVKRGGSPTNETIYGNTTVNVYEKATSLSIINPTTGASYTGDTLPTNSSVNIGVSMAPYSSYESDPVSYTSSNPAIATVVKTGKDTATITAGDTQGTAKITVSTQSGSKTATFSVTVSNNINFAEVTGIDASYVYTGSDIKPVPVVTYNGNVLSTATDYTVTYSNNKAAGTATVTITGKNNFNKSTKVINFEITPKEFSEEFLTVGVNSAFYQITDTVPAPLPTLTVKDTQRNASLTLNTDYTLEAINNTVSGDATAILTGKGNYAGTYQVTYKVCDSIKKATISAIPNQKYTGTAITPNVTVKYNGRTLTKDTDYTVSYSYNTAVGTATVTVVGKNPYFKDSTTAQFKIVPKTVTGAKSTAQTASSITLGWAQVPNATGYQIFDVSANKVIKTVTGATTLTYKKTSLSAMKTYQYKIRAYQTINGKNYYGAYSSVVTATTKPATPSLTLKTGSKYVTASWKKISSVSGYQIQYSTKSSFSGAKTTKLSASTTSKKFTSLKKGTKYYVRIRAYKTLTINGKKITVYSAWSTKSITCK